MKEYVKPELFFESFELSEQIATCSDMLIANYKNTAECEVNNPLGISTMLFVKENTDCKTYDYEGYCYFNGGDGMTIFSS